MPETFLRDLAAHVRAGDMYGRLDSIDDERLLRAYVLRPEAPGDLALPCVADPAAVARLRAFYRAVAAGVERGTGLPTGYLLDLDDEGYGRAVILVGRLVALRETIRDVNGFGFRGLRQLAERGAAAIRAAVRLAGVHPEVTCARS